MPYRFIIPHSKPFLTFRQTYYWLLAGSCFLWALVIAGIWQALIVQ
jgi:hypothetical protein